MFGGVAWYVGDRYGAHAAMVPFAILALSSLISYQRAKAESLGLGQAALMERPSASSCCVSGWCSTPYLMPTLWFMLTLLVVTAVQRFVKVWNQASPAPVVIERRVLRRTRRTARHAATLNGRNEFRRRRP